MRDLVYIAVAVLFVAVIAQGLVLLGVMRQLGAVLIAVQPGAPRDVGGGPDVGEPIAVDGISLNGGAVFAFVSPNCEPCEELRPALVELPGQYPSVSIVPVIAFGGDDERARYAELFGKLARSDLAHLHEDWSIPGTPYAVSVDGSGRVRAKGIVTTAEQLTTMAELAGRDPAVNEREAMRTDGTPAEAAAAGNGRQSQTTEKEAT